MRELINFLFGIYSVGLVYVGWRIGRASKWEEVNNAPPGSVPVLTETKLGEPDDETQRNRPRSLSVD